MHFFRKNRRFIAWFASLVIVLNTLVPALSHAMDSGHGKSLLMEICSAAGNKSAIAIPLNSEMPVGSQAGTMQHCPYCLTHAGSFALMVNTEPLLINPDLSYSLPELYYHSPRPLFAWATSNPRAPPRLS